MLVFGWKAGEMRKQPLPSENGAEGRQAYHWGGAILHASLSSLVRRRRPQCSDYQFLMHLLPLRPFFCFLPNLPFSHLTISFFHSINCVDLCWVPVCWTTCHMRLSLTPAYIASSFGDSFDQLCLSPTRHALFQCVTCPGSHQIASRPLALAAQVHFSLTTGFQIKCFFSFTITILMVP